MGCVPHRSQASPKMLHCPGSSPKSIPNLGSLNSSEITQQCAEHTEPQTPQQHKRPRGATTPCWSTTELSYLGFPKQRHCCGSAMWRTFLQDTWYPVPETLPHTGPVHAEQLQYMHGTCRPWPYSTHAPTLQGIPTAGAGGQGEHECCVTHSDSSPIYLPCNVHSFVLLYHITLICILPTVTSPCRCNLAATEVVIYAGW